MLDWWMSRPRAFRIGVAFALIVVGAVLLWYVWVNYPHSRRAGRGPMFVLCAGCTLLVLEVFFAEVIFGGTQRHDAAADDPAQRPVVERWVNVPPEKFEAVCNALAAAFGGVFALEKRKLLGMMVKAEAASLRELSWPVKFDGADLPVRMRLLGLDNGTLELGLVLPPPLLAPLMDSLRTRQIDPLGERRPG